MRLPRMIALFGLLALACAGKEDATESGGETGLPDDTATDTAPATYEGGWPIGACADSLTATGYGTGDVPADFTFPDQYGEDVRLYAFCDRVVLLSFDAAWDAASQEGTHLLAQTTAQYDPAEYTAVEVLLENANHDPAGESDAARWATTYEATWPVLAGNGTDPVLLWTASPGLPYRVLLGPGLVVVAQGTDITSDDVSELVYANR